MPSLEIKLLIFPFSTVYRSVLVGTNEGSRRDSMCLLCAHSIGRCIRKACFLYIRICLFINSHIVWKVRIKADRQRSRNTYDEFLVHILCVGICVYVAIMFVALDSGERA